MARPSDHRTSSEVDVALEASLARIIQKPKQGRALGRSCSAANHYDDAMMWFVFGQLEKIVTIASEKHAIIVMCELKHRFV
jgi:hypothetical protein